jgi:uncharacterized protein (DUF433 family)
MNGSSRKHQQIFAMPPNTRFQPTPLRSLRLLHLQLNRGPSGRHIDSTRFRGMIQVGGGRMTEQQLLERITLNPKVMVGKPVIKGTRLTVEYVLNLLAHGATAAEILEEYQGLAPEDIQACLLFATKSLANTTFVPLLEPT